MTQYEVYAPIAVTASNFEAFRNLLSSGGQVMPTAIARFVTDNKSSAFREILGQQILVMPADQADKADRYVQIRLFTSDASNPPASSRMAALFLDVIPQAGGGFNTQPRQWLLGRDAQALIPYKMSCCEGLSAIAVYKQQGRLLPALLENTKFVLLSRNDLFGLSGTGESGLKIDQTGDMLTHWYTHLMRIRHDCASHAKIALPQRLPAFRKG